MRWALLLLLIMVAAGDSARSGVKVVEVAEWVLIFLISAFAAGEMARAHRRSVNAWVGWATVIGPLAPVLLLALDQGSASTKLQTNTLAR
jgi:hypothetical protein